VKVLQKKTMMMMMMMMMMMIMMSLGSTICGRKGEVPPVFRITPGGDFALFSDELVGVGSKKCFRETKPMMRTEGNPLQSMEHSDESVRQPDRGGRNRKRWNRGRKDGSLLFDEATFSMRRYHEWATGGADNLRTEKK
jgi:hypothetical protein